MLRACAVELLGNERPLLALFENGADENSIFLDGPAVMALVGIEVVVPSLTALLAGPEVAFLRSDKELLGDFVPAVFYFFFPESY